MAGLQVTLLHWVVNDHRLRLLLTQGGALHKGAVTRGTQFSGLLPALGLGVGVVNGPCLHGALLGGPHHAPLLSEQSCGHIPAFGHVDGGADWELIRHLVWHLLGVTDGVVHGPAHVLGRFSAVRDQGGGALLHHLSH